MLSHNYRIKLEEICNRIETHQEVSLQNIIWAEKLAKSNRSAAEILRKARRIAIQGKGEPGSLDEFLQTMDLGFADPREHRSHFNGADDIANFFHNDEEMRRD
jgi:hypothetical protein